MAPSRVVFGLLSLIAAASTLVQLPPHAERGPANLEGIEYLGCFPHRENYKGVWRALTRNLLDADDMTAAKCASHCVDYTFFGVEYGSECWCGNKSPRKAVPDSECHFPCPGDNRTICGAAKRINVWGSPLTAQIKIGSYRYKGCYTDKRHDRTFIGGFFHNNYMTPTRCAESCAGFPYFGVEWGTQCFCGLDLAPGSERVGHYECNEQCGGDDELPCGDADRLTVYHDEGVSPVSNPKTVGKYGLKGCFSDSRWKRSLEGNVLRQPDMTIEMCVGFCKGFQYLGLEYGSQCYCGSKLSGEQVAEEQCGMLCQGDSSQLCGAADRLTVYSLKDY